MSLAKVVVVLHVLFAMQVPFWPSNQLTLFYLNLSTVLLLTKILII